MAVFASMRESVPIAINVLHDRSVDAVIQLINIQMTCDVRAGITRTKRSCPAGQPAYTVHFPVDY